MITHLPRLLALAVVLLGATAAISAQQNPHGRLPVTSFAEPYLFLIRDPVVHEELELTDQQRQEIGELNDQLDVQLWSMRNKSAQHIETTIQQATATAKTRLSSVLQGDQQRRLSQIVLRTLGTKAFLHDELPEKLELSEKQRQEIRKTVTDTQEAVDELIKQRQAEDSDKSLDKKYRTLKTDEQRQILATLTSSQRDEWVSLLGEQIDVSKLGGVKFKVPELHGQSGWINSQPLTMQQLKGKVVALHFYAFNCINCKRNLPWYKGWHESFADQGLVVIGVHTPETSAEHDVESVHRNARDSGLKFPILIDNDKQNWGAWGNSIWPSVYLIDKQGYVRYWWYGELNWQGAEGEQLLRKRIEELLSEE